MEENQKEIKRNKGNIKVETKDEKQEKQKDERRQKIKNEK